MKKLIAAAAAALLALTAFVGCSLDAAYSTKELTEATVDLAGTKSGYGLKITMENEKVKLPLEFVTDSNYSQAAIKLPYKGMAKAEIELTCSGPICVGFLADGASPWDGRLAGKDQYFEKTKDDVIEVNVPADAAFITLGGNNQTGVKVKVTSITLKAN